MDIRPKGPEAARLRQRKFALIRQFRLPDNLLPGSLSLTHTHCGKPTCHCAQGEGHPVWSLTFMVKGKKRVERIPLAWMRSEEHTSELQSRLHLVCRLLLEKKKTHVMTPITATTRMPFSALKTNSRPRGGGCTIRIRRSSRPTAHSSTRTLTTCCSRIYINA